MPNTSSNGSPDEPRDGIETGRGRRGALAGVGALATLLVAAGWFLPVWQTRLYAPQYPGGLTTIAYGHHMAGDIDEVNILNHYVGLGMYDPSMVPEMRLWPVALGVALLSVVVALRLRPRLPGRLAAAYLWLLPVGVLAVIQFRLHQFGHDITPGAAFRLDPFTPRVVGRTTVWNFETWSWPGTGLLAIVAAAGLVTFGPRLLAPRRRSPRAATVVVAIATSALALAAPAALAADHDAHHGHHGHTTSEPAAGDEVDGHHGHVDPDGTLGPTIGPEHHAAMPSIVEHPPAGDLADVLAAAQPGEVVRLPAGTYRGPVVIDRPVVIEGEGLPIIEGNGDGSVITVRAPGTVIRGVVVRGSGPGPTGDPAGIRIEADDITVEGAVLLHNYVGIAVDTAAAVKLLDNHVHGRAAARIVDEDHAVATDEDEGHAGAEGHAGHATHAERDAHSGHEAHARHATPAEHGTHVMDAASSGPGRGDGIWLHDVDHIVVRGNHVVHVRDGVYVSFGAGALIDGNHVQHSRYALHTMFAREMSVVQNHFVDNLSGLVLMYGGDLLLLRNHVEGSTSASTGFGVLLKDVVGVEATQNLLVDNRVGLHLDGPNETAENLFMANTVARNSVGVHALPSARATFGANSFADNAVQVAATKLPRLEWASRGWGNYWSSYRGYDRGDGKGAVPHTEGGVVDRLLLRHPELAAIADGPGLRLLRAIEERWGSRQPVVVDPAPLTVPLSPPLPVSDERPLHPGAGLAVAFVLVLPTVGLSWRHRRRSLRRSRTRVALA
ncbi:NosD domain-containing protein [Egicoccus sp. AB-alg6-2]|uniref:NosD domain-containing protein n=1 Tax=Egicoccus sp. AB-alg6-2 TaxID=3242692 RepID=UPI00359DD4CC